MLPFHRWLQEMGNLYHVSQRIRVSERNFRVLTRYVVSALWPLVACVPPNTNKHESTQSVVSEPALVSQVAVIVDSVLHDSSATSLESPPFLLPSLRYGMDTTVSPCTDFDRYVNGGWRNSVIMPNGLGSYDVFYSVSLQANQYIRRLLDSTRLVIATTPDADARVVGQYYSSCLLADSLERSLAVSSMAGAQKNDTTRAARCQRLVMKDLQDALGQVFMRSLLPPSAERHAQNLVMQIQHAAARRTSRLFWMAPDAKKRVAITLSRMKLKVAKPDVTIDHSRLQLTSRDVSENQRAIQQYIAKYKLITLNRDANALWTQSQYTANALYSYGTNAIEVPSFMFQWPFFTMTGDEAMAYAGVGMIIGHEMYHGITESSRSITDSGYKALSERLVRQYTTLPRIEGVEVNGKGNLNENLADLGGLLAAYDAWEANRRSKRSTTSEGFTPEQRFFLHYARVWRSKITMAAASIHSRDSHAPSQARINGVLMNIPAFAKAFGCREGDLMAPSAAERVDIW